jgi:flavin reductase (DIM6/NTAB) family NADH-FMN oxidoreductase RutF
VVAPCREIYENNFSLNDWNELEWNHGSREREQARAVVTKATHVGCRQAHACSSPPCRDSPSRRIGAASHTAWGRIPVSIGASVSIAVAITVTVSIHIIITIAVHVGVSVPVGNVSDALEIYGMIAIVAYAHGRFTVVETGAMARASHAIAGLKAPVAGNETEECAKGSHKLLGIEAVQDHTSFRHEITRTRKVRDSARHKSVAVLSSIAMELDPQKLSIPERYKLLIGCIVPRPIAFVSTISTDGVPNVAPFSFFAGVGSNPMTLLFCPANTPKGDEKDTLRNCKPREEGGTGEFVVNAVTEAYAVRVAAAAEPLPPEESEFELIGLSTAPSVSIAPPRVAESPVSFECETQHVIRTNPGEPAGGNIVIGRVLRVHLREGLVNDRMHTDPDVLSAVGRMGGLTYCTTGNRFDIPIGRPALDLIGEKDNE